MTPTPSRLQSFKAWWAARWRRIAVSVGLMAVFFGNQGFRSLVRNYLELRKLRGEIAALQDEQAHSAARLSLLHSGDSAVERLARRELGYVKKGEIEYRFPPPAPEK